MSPEIVAVVPDSPSPSADAVEQALAARNRPYRVLHRNDLTDLPGQTRALVAVDVVPDDALNALADALLAQGAPVLAIGASASLLPGAATHDEHQLMFTTLHHAGSAADDPVAKGIASGCPVVTSVSLAADGFDGETLGAGPDGGPLLLRSGENAYATAVAIAVDPEDAAVAAVLPTPAKRSARIIRGWGAGIVSRWLDGVVGRDDDESPWGRRGPSPVQVPGLYLSDRA